MRRRARMVLSRNSSIKTSKINLSLTIILSLVFATCQVQLTNFSPYRNSVLISNTKKNWNKSKKKNKEMVSVRPCSKQATPGLQVSEFPAVNQVYWPLPSSPTPSTPASSAMSTTTRTVTVAFQGQAIQLPCSSNSHSTISKSSATLSWWEELVVARDREYRSRDLSSSQWARHWVRSFRRSGRIFSSSWLFLEVTPRCPREWSLCRIGPIICQSSQRLRLKESTSWLRRTGESTC